MILEKFCKYGKVGGKMYCFTNWNPETNQVWSDELPSKIKDEPDGRWINMDSVRWM